MLTHIQAWRSMVLDALPVNPLPAVPMVEKAQPAPFGRGESLAIVLPSEFSGGDLVVEHKGTSKCPLARRKCRQSQRWGP